MNFAVKNIFKFENPKDIYIPMYIHKYIIGSGGD